MPPKKPGIFSALRPRSVGEVAAELKFRAAERARHSPIVGSPLEHAPVENDVERTPVPITATRLARPERRRAEEPDPMVLAIRMLHRMESDRDQQTRFNPEDAPDWEEGIRDIQTVIAGLKDDAADDVRAEAAGIVDRFRKDAERRHDLQELKTLAAIHEALS